MESGTREQIRILNEKGIVEKKGAGFHTPLEFASEHLFYVVWSSHYVCNRLYSVQRDYLNYYSLIYVLGGKMEIEYEGEKFIVGENEAVLLDFRKPHAYRAVSDRLDKWEMVFKGNAIDAYYELITATWGRIFKVAGRLRERICVLMETLDSPRPGDHTVSMLIHADPCHPVRDRGAEHGETVACRRKGSQLYLQQLRKAAAGRRDSEPCFPQQILFFKNI